MFKAICRRIANVWRWCLPLVSVVIGILSSSVTLGVVCYFTLGFWFLHRDECWGHEELSMLVGISKPGYTSTWNRVTMTGVVWCMLLFWPLGYYLYESGALDGLDGRQFTEED